MSEPATPADEFAMRIALDQAQNALLVGEVLVGASRPSLAIGIAHALSSAELRRRRIDRGAQLGKRAGRCELREFRCDRLGWTDEQAHMGRTEHCGIVVRVADRDDAVVQALERSHRFIEEPRRAADEASGDQSLKVVGELEDRQIEQHDDDADDDADRCHQQRLEQPCRDVDAAR